MKKSTLITTIAMIVVVVVALSTATYAWFTSSAVTTATVTLTTESASELSLALVKNVTSEQSWSSAESGTGLELTANGGLWAPQGAINAAVLYSTSTIDATNTTTSFYEANYKTASTATQKSASETWGMDVMRITNITSDPKAVYLYIVVAIDGDAANTNNIYAAQATSFYINCKYYNNQDATQQTVQNLTVTNGYGKDDGSVSYAADAILVKANSNQSASGLSEVTVATGKNTLTTRPTYNGLNTSFLHCAENAALGIAQGQYALIYCVKICDMQTDTTVPETPVYTNGLAANDSIILGAYTWIDGWTANNAAGNANYHVTYAFTVSPITVTTI